MKSTAEIARELGITERMVQMHLASALGKIRSQRKERDFVRLIVLSTAAQGASR